ncbi:MAG TPA: prepilin peptidase [Firmicutes bacterium]|nr:prepilin peptidase [Bacillota bacterium]
MSNGFTVIPLPGPLASLLALVVGAVTGSFLNVCIHRLPRGEPVAYPGSHCPSCGSGLTARDLVPILSYIALRGRCRHCGARIPARYPVVELGTGAVFWAIWATGVRGWGYWGGGPGAAGQGAGAGGVTWAMVSGAVLVCLVMVAGIIDLEHGLIPDRVTFPGMAAGLVAGLMAPAPVSGSHLAGLWSSILGLAAGGGLVLVVAALSRGGMGGGDVKLLAMVGSFLGPLGAVEAFFIACIIGAIVGAGLILAGRKGRKDHVPFGPFVAASTIAMILFGGALPWRL